jgi:hypothetical protein
MECVEVNLERSMVVYLQNGVSQDEIVGEHTAYVSAVHLDYSIIIVQYDEHYMLNIRVPRADLEPGSYVKVKIS